MDVLQTFFSLFCAQTPERTFWIGGEALPVCQRCLGVYCGLLFGAATLPAAFRRVAVAPGRPGLALIAGAIAAMVVMASHLVDPGPLSRFVGGYAFGAALAWLAVPVVKSRGFAHPSRRASGRETLALIARNGAAVALLVLIVDRGGAAFYPAVCTIALLGWLVGFSLLAALAATAKSRLRSRDSAT
jgi:uncharacterized membrane protein